MTKKSQTVSIRLLRVGKLPADSVRAGVTLSAWGKLEGAQVSFGNIGNPNGPKWANFLELSVEEKATLRNSTAFGLIFVEASKRWFAVTFGLGHVKLDPDAFEQDFGLRVVLNTTSRRTQTARRSDQTAFSIDIERDIVRGLAGEPKSVAFASRVAGSDGLILTKEMEVADLPQVCADAFAAFGKTDYKTNFAWIDQIKHVRDKATIDSLDASLAAALNSSLTTAIPDTLHLAYPVIYDPEKARHIQFKGFRSTNVHTDLEISAYVGDLKEKGLTAYTVEHLSAHKAHECDADGKDEGGIWKIKECLVFETDLNGQKYVLAGDRWYCIDVNLAKEVTDFFTTIPLHAMPAANADDNEETYNTRVASGGHNMLCLDRKTVKPTGANYPIEACDFLGKDGALIHVKDHTSSSRLSHLFNQGTVSAQVLKSDGAFRDLLLAEIAKQEVALTLTGYQALIPDKAKAFDATKHKIVYAVLCSNNTARLPFFSLVTFRQAARELRNYDFPVAFAWIKKPASTKTKKPRKPKAGGGAAP
jgi:uncharacterized protein (TIGR04141 family)